MSKTIISIDVIEILIAIMIFIITSNVIAIRRDFRNVNENTLLQNENYYKKENL